MMRPFFLGFIFSILFLRSPLLFKKHLRHRPLNALVTLPHLHTFGCRSTEDMDFAVIRRLMSAEVNAVITEAFLGFLISLYEELLRSANKRPCSMPIEQYFAVFHKHKRLDTSFIEQQHTVVAHLVMSPYIACCSTE